MMLKRLGAFLFIAAFGFAAVQPAAGQIDNVAHTVTVDVNEIEKISASGNPSFGISSVEELNDWVIAEENATLTTTTNVHSDRKITVKAISIDTDEPQGNIGLQVSALDDVGGEATTKDDTRILGFNSTGLEEARDLITGFQTVYNEEIDLQYEAKVNEDYNPNNRTRVRVEYTLVSVSN
jgi:hypothetical protein